MTKSNIFDEKGTGWKPISKYNKGDNILVDLWLEITPLSSSRSVMWRWGNDAFGTHNAYLKNGEWFDDGGKLDIALIKEWRIP